MKIFFTASQKGKPQFGSYYEQIVLSLQKTGNEVIVDPNLTLNPDVFYHQFEGPTTSEELKDFYEQMMEGVREADVCVFDCSYRSVSVGTLIDRALDLNKPVVCLYYKGNRPLFLAAVGVVEETLSVCEYADDTIEVVVTNAIRKSSDHRLKRVNFLISPSLLTQLETICKAEGITKSRLIRKLIMDYQKKLTSER
jgi:hypothetical protein